VLLLLSNPQRQIWFIPQRHLRAYKLIDSDEFFLEKAQAGTVRPIAGGAPQHRSRL
jgi:hypothetical protein